MSEKREPPAWLLSQLFVKTGVFNNDQTAIISGFDTQERTLSEPTGSAPGQFEIDLVSRTDWEAVRQRLLDEGFL